MQWCFSVRYILCNNHEYPIRHIYITAEKHSIFCLLHWFVQYSCNVAKVASSHLLNLRDPVLMIDVEVLSLVFTRKKNRKEDQ